jgi:hypothetical protein
MYELPPETWLWVSQQKRQKRQIKGKFPMDLSQLHFIILYITLEAEMGCLTV